MSFADSFGQGFGWYGAHLGKEMTEPEKKLIFEYLKQQDADADRTGTTAFSGISTDPRTRTAQMEALQSMLEVANQKGLDPQSKAMNAEAEREAAGFEQSQRAAVQQSLAARGMGGSGAEVAALNSAQQGSANRAHQTSLQSAADARQRALAAMAGAGQLGGQMHAQDYTEAANKARAQDEAARFHYGAKKDSRQGLANYYAADRAEQIGDLQAGGQAAGSGLGSVTDAAASYMTMGAYQGGNGGGGGGRGGGWWSGYGQGGGGGGRPLDAGNPDYPLEESPYGSWGGWGTP